MEDANLITWYQAEFRTQISTINQLLRITTDIQIALNNGKRAAAVFMDLTSAFDTVLYKLYPLNLPTIIMRWINNFLTDRTTRIKFGSELSDDIHINRGAT